MDRKHEIDNLRWMMILLLFPFHAALCFDGGEFGGFFVWLHRNVYLHAFATFIYPWFMSLLFVLAGISARYSLTKRGTGDFIRERSKKLLLPLLLGMLLLVPPQTYIADLYWNHFDGTYLQHLKTFFTKFTYFTGYDASFTPSHLWFLLYLYVYSLLLLPLKGLLSGVLGGARRSVSSGPMLLPPSMLRLPYPLLLLLFLPEYLFLPVLNIPSKSAGQYFFLFLCGYLIFFLEKVMAEAVRGRRVSLALFLSSGALYTWAWCGKYYMGIWMPLLYLFFGWCGILTLLGYGKKYWNRRNRVTAFLSKTAFSLYLLHMPVEVVLMYAIARTGWPDLVQFLAVTILAFLLTMLLCIAWGSVQKKIFSRKRRKTAALSSTNCV